MAVLAGGAFGCAGEEGQSITVFAAANSKAAMEEAGKAFEEETGIKVYLTFGGSGALLSQMQLSQSGDIYIPASHNFLVQAMEEQIVPFAEEKRLAYLIPAILVRQGNPQNIRSLEDLATPGLKLAISDPATVPAGLYAFEILEYNGLLKEVGKNILTFGENYEKTASYVILGAVDAAIGWDILGIQRQDMLDVVYFKPDQLPRLPYMSATLTRFTENKENAQRFLDFLTSAEGQALFRKHGYVTSLDEAKNFAPNAELAAVYRLPENYLELLK